MCATFLLLLKGTQNPCTTSLGDSYVVLVQVGDAHGADWEAAINIGLLVSDGAGERLASRF
jgi:hypothetical protein